MNTEALAKAYAKNRASWRGSAVTLRTS